MSTKAAAVSANIGWNYLSSASFGLNVSEAWNKYSGKGVSMGVFDDGIVADASLAGALGVSKAVTSVSDTVYGKHGTAVAGLIAAAPDGSGAVGIADGASLTSVEVLGMSNAAIGLQMARAAAFDVTNSSFGWGSMLYVDRGAQAWTNFFNGITAAADHGRHGLGTVQVVAAGNYRTSAGDTNLSNFTNDHHVITVGAVTSEGAVASYSSPGASLLVVAPSNGGATGIVTTDLPGAAGFSAGSTTDVFGGTSAATPEVSAVVALMLEANAGLGWRDVSTILAATAVQLPGSGAVTNGGTHWNGGGMAFSNDTGFGLVDASAAVRLAETWTEQNTSANEATVTVSASGTKVLTASSSISYGFDVAQAVGVESVEITLKGAHPHVGDLTVELVSASGTVSTVLKNVGGNTAFSTYTLDTNAFRGELSAGHWMLKVTDAAGGGTGTFTGATLAIHGDDTPDHTFIFTDAYAGLPGRDTLHDASGLGIINAAATTADTVIDLHAGSTSNIGGKLLHLFADSTFSFAIGGAGDDHLIASEAGGTLIGGGGHNRLTGGAGDDRFVIGDGQNVVDGGQGFDRATFSGKAADWTISRDGDGTLHVSQGTTALDTLHHVERLAFDDHVLAFDIDGDAGQAYRLYHAALDRAPDLDGLNFWIGARDGGATLHAIADGFIQSTEFATRFGTNLSNDAFVTALYENTLGRAPDAEGLAFWTHTMDTALLDHAGVLVSFSESAEFSRLVAPEVHTGILLA